MPNIEVDAEEIRKTTCYICSLPRLMMSDFAFSLVEGSRDLGMRTFKGFGVFWGQVLTGNLEDAIKAGYKYAVTTDSDSPHRTPDVAYLYAAMENKPHADAIAAFQMKRGGKSVLISWRDRLTGNPGEQIMRGAFDGDMVRATAAHFGLTIFRLSSLAAMPRPWFHSVPDANGSWGPGHIDEDIVFWRRFEAAGLSLFVATKLIIPHMEWTCLWPRFTDDGDVLPEYQAIDDYETKGMPDYVRRRVESKEKP
jgi:hypothetical protein